MRINTWVVGLLFGAACLAPGLSREGAEPAAIKANHKTDFAAVVAAT